MSQKIESKVLCKLEDCSIVEISLFLLDFIFITCFMNHYFNSPASCRAILSQFTEEQMNRYESFRRSGFQKSNMRRVCQLTYKALFPPCVIKWYPYLFSSEFFCHSMMIKLNDLLPGLQSSICLLFPFIWNSLFQ